MKLDVDATERARRENPSLTVFDTGEMLEPHYEFGDSKTGVVEFDDSEGATQLRVFAHPSGVDDDTIVVQIDTLATTKYIIMLNEAVLFSGDPEEKK